MGNSGYQANFWSPVFPMHVASEAPRSNRDGSYASSPKSEARTGSVEGFNQMSTKLTSSVKQVPPPPEYTLVFNPEGLLFVDPKQKIKICGVEQVKEMPGYISGFTVNWGGEQLTFKVETISQSNGYFLTLNKTFNEINCPVALKVTVHNGVRPHNFIIGANSNGCIYFAVV